jgi:cytochrome c oxidase subunit I
MASESIGAGDAAVLDRHHTAAQSTPLWEYFTWSTDHKVIGIQYGVTAFLFFLVGGLAALGVRSELWNPETGDVLSNARYNSLFTLHATVMIFLFIVPMGGAFANYIIPLQIGAQDMAFPWLNAFAYWVIPAGGFCILLGYFLNGPAEAGWTAYPPLSVIAGEGQTFWAIGLHLLGISSIMGSVNFIVTIVNMRAPGMGWWQMPLMCWAVLATAILALLATPFLAGALTLLLFERLAGTSFFESQSGQGDVLIWQNVFWFYSHPAVYIMVLPSMGIVSEVLSVFSRKPIFGYKMIALSSLGIAALGFMVWAHHMFASLAPALRIPFMITSMIIAVPTGIKIFSWLATLWRGKIRVKTPLLFSLGFLSMFVVGGISGVILASVPVDVHMHDTYFVVAHLHFVLFGGSVFGIYSGIYYWFPKFTGRMYNEPLGVIHFILTYIGFFMTFFPMHLLGSNGMPRRVAWYAEEFTDMNRLATMGAGILGFSTLFFIANVLYSLLFGARAGANPWNALTLEWQVSSPPPKHNFLEQPIPAVDPYGYGTPEGAAYLRGERPVVALEGAGAHRAEEAADTAAGD